MTHEAFSTPVQLLLGLGIPRPVSNVMQAYAILGDLPRAEAPSAHDAACRACLNAIRRIASVDEARAAFVAFANESGRLVSPVESQVGRATHAAPSSVLA